MIFLGLIIPDFPISKRQMYGMIAAVVMILAVKIRFVVNVFYDESNFSGEEESKDKDE